jgi:hypothetical protein
MSAEWMDGRLEPAPNFVNAIAFAEDQLDLLLRIVEVLNRCEERLNRISRIAQGYQDDYIS